MPSLSDIPDQLLNADKKLAFINWLQTPALATSTRRTLAHMWSGATGATFSRDEWDQINTRAPKG